MGISRAVKIWILLVMNASLFVVEISVGFAVGSIALQADAFHMLNDTISLMIALYSIRVSKRSASVKYTYGWHRAEVIAALTNGVFLLALCFSIFLQSLERFSRPSEINDPRLVVIVGSVGLACNIIGLLLFHEHGHDHAHGGSHSHSRSNSQGGDHVSMHDNPVGSSPAAGTQTPVRRSNSVHSVYGLPAQQRVALKQVAQEYYQMSLSESNNALDRQERGENDIISEEHPDVTRARQAAVSDGKLTPVQNLPEPSHADGSLNIRAVFIHVLGDALGSLGVVVSGLIIWFVQSPSRLYADPALSVAITILIMCSAVPLVRSAGFILLQGVPSFISLAEVRRDIAEVQGVESVHELHVWQLSEARLIASVHIKVSSARPYMDIARDVKSVLHQNGIHSGTVQPEFVDDISDTKCEITCPPNTCSVKEACCPLPPIKED